MRPVVEERPRTGAHAVLLLLPALLWAPTAVLAAPAAPTHSPAAPVAPAPAPPAGDPAAPLPITPTVGGVPSAEGAVPLPSLVPEEEGGRTFHIPVPSEGGTPRPLTLEEAYILGSKHPTMKAAQESITQADLADDRVLTAWLPQVNAIGSYTHYNDEMKMGFPDYSPGSMQPLSVGGIPITIPTPDGGSAPYMVPTKSSEIVLQKQDSFGGVLNLQAPLFVGPLLPALASARDAQQVARLQFGRARSSFLFQAVALPYYGAVGAGEAVEVARKSLELTRKHYEATQRMFEVGQAPRLAVLQAEIAVVQADQKLRQALTGWTTALRSLEILLGVEGPLQLQHPPLPMLPEGNESQLLVQALKQREDVQATTYAVEIARRGQKQALWKYAPILSANGMYRWSDSENFAGENDSWQVGLNLTVPLFDGGTRTVDRHEADSKLRQSLEQRHALEATIANEINAQLKAVQEAEANVVTVRHTVGLAREGVAAAQASYEVGMATNLEVLDANQKLFEAEIGLIQITIQLDLARMQLAHAVGAYRPLPVPPGQHDSQQR